MTREPLRFNRRAPAAEELAERFERLCRLRPGTTVTVATGTAKFVGQFLRVDESGNERRLVIKQNPGSRDEFIQTIPEGGAHSVAVAGLGLSCLIIGQLSVLEPEIRNGEIVTPEGSPLQEVLKTGRFCGASERDIRSDVLPTLAGEVPRELRDARPAVVVFDGARAFRRWKEAWRRAAWIVVLDRTCQQFDEGVVLVEQEYVEDRYDDEDPLAELDVAQAVELMSFWRRGA